MKSMKSQAVRVRRAATTVFVLLSVALLIDAVVLSSYPSDDDAALRQLVYRSPVAAYLFAVWAVRIASDRLASGRPLDAVLPRLLRRLGAALMAGATLAVVVAPLALRSMTGAGSYVVFDPAAFATLAVGALLLLLADLMRSAARWRTELDEIV